MPYDLPLPEPWAGRGWKAKIFDKEDGGAPHVTVLFRGVKWRIGLRDGKCLDTEPEERLMDPAVAEHVRGSLTTLVRAWDEMHPENPVWSEPEIEPPPKEPKKRGKTRRKKK
jgi:hypothetical protein